MPSPVNWTDLSWGSSVQLIKCKSVNKPQVSIVFAARLSHMSLLLLLLLLQLQSQSGVRTRLSQFHFGVDNGSLLNGRPHTLILITKANLTPGCKARPGQKLLS